MTFVIILCCYCNNFKSFSLLIYQTLFCATCRKSYNYAMYNKTVIEFVFCDIANYQPHLITV